MNDEPTGKTPPNPRFQASVTPDGRVRVPVSKKTKRRLDNLRQPGESDDDVMRRIMGKPKGVTATSGLVPISDEDQRKLDIALSIKAGTLKPVGMDEKIKLSKDPLHPSKFVVVNKGEISAADEAFDPTRTAVDLGIVGDQAGKVVRTSATSLGGDVGAQVFGAMQGKTARPQTISEAAKNARNETAALGGVFSDPRIAEWVHAQGKLNTARVRLDTAKKNLTEAEARLWVANSNAAVEFVRKIDSDPIMQKVGESGFHNCVEAWRNGDVLVPGDDRIMPQEIRDAVGVNPTVFVVQHDWAAAFAKAQDFADGEYRVPYREAIYEFRISGARVIACVATEDDLPKSCILNVKTPQGWIIAGFYTMDHGRWTPARVFAQQKRQIAERIMAVCGAQIRAIAIALDAEVAETTVVRAPHRLNMKRERKGRLPLFDFHVIDLSHRKRYVPLPQDPNREVHQRRLHFVRGHWRHYDNHKTWIRWHLRGNPDLGFIDKEYRL